MLDLKAYLTGESSEVFIDFPSFDLSLESSSPGSKREGSVAYVLDELFSKIKFDKKLIKKIVAHNVEFITKNPEIRDMMGGKLVGCFEVKYTQYHKDIFYNDVFDMSYDEVVGKLKEITTIPSHFKIARDDINMVCYYTMHRFLANRDLGHNDRQSGAIEILNYFGYRTLVLLNANYWIHPIKREVAMSLSESLSNKYLISRLKNWNEYVNHRSENYLRGNYVKVNIRKGDDSDIPNAINDIYNGYKDTILKIYRDFVALEEQNIITSSKSVVTDLEGRDVLLDRLTDPRKYIDKVLNALTSRDIFIRHEIVEVSSSIVTSISQDQLTECLELTLDYYYKRPSNSSEVSKFIEDYLVDSIAYLQERKIFINNSTNILEVVNAIVGNILYSRGADVSITVIKDRGEKLVKDIYKSGRVTISSRNVSGMRNILCVYLLIIALA